MLSGYLIFESSIMFSGLQSRWTWKKVFFEASWVLQAGGGIFLREEVLLGSDADDNGSIKWRLL